MIFQQDSFTLALQTDEIYKKENQINILTLKNSVITTNTVYWSSVCDKEADLCRVVRQKKGKTKPSFIKQRWKIDGIFLPTFLSNETGTWH
jgi:hypothetical protein